MGWAINKTPLGVEGIQMSNQQETQTEPKKPTRNAATQLHVFYEDPAANGERGMTAFNFKQDLDKWLAETNVTVIKIVRGVEKKFTAQNRVTLS